VRLLICGFGEKLNCCEEDGDAGGVRLEGMEDVDAVAVDFEDGLKSERRDFWWLVCGVEVAADDCGGVGLDPLRVARREFVEVGVGMPEPAFEIST